MWRIAVVLVYALGFTFGAAGRAAAEAPEEAKGRILFLRNCSECHGLEAAGDGPEGQFLAKAPANLRDGRILSRYRDEEITAFVREGKALRIDLRPERVKQHADETEALYQFIRKLPEIDWQKWEAGERVYVERCVDCHDYYGRPSALRPEGIAAPRDLSDPKLQASVTDDELAKLARHGKKGMPALVPPLSEADAKRVAAYVRILSPGYALYDRYCVDCHGARGEGGTGPHVKGLAPKLAFDAEFFRLNYPDEVRRTIWHMLRDENPSMPHFREALSEADVKAILVYLRSLAGSQTSATPGAGGT